MTKCDQQAKATAVLLISGIKWILNIIKSKHNHPMDINTSAEPAYRKRDEHILLIITAMADLNYTPQAIHSFLTKRYLSSLYTR